MMKIATAQLWVHDQDEALKYWTEKVGFEVRSDVTVPEMGNFRWLTVSPPAQPDVAIVLMAIPGPPMVDAATDEQLRDLLGKGLAGTVFLTTDDCWATYRELKERGRRVHRGAGGADVRHRRRLPRPVGQQRAAQPAPRRLRSVRRRSMRRSDGGPNPNRS